jgi:hypothetical protein
VQFLVNNTALGSRVALAGGVASYTWTPSCSTLGQQSLTAVYSGDSNYQGSIGPALTANGTGNNSSGAIINTPLIVTVTPGTCPSFSVAGPSGSNTTVTVAAGGTIPPVTITVAPQNGFTGTVSLASYVVVTAGDSAGALPTISFNPASVTIPSGSTASVTTSLTLSGITAGLRMPNPPGKMDPGTMMLARQSPGRTPPWFAAGSGIAIASLLLLVLPRRRRLGGLLLVALSIALASGLTGCGGSSQTAPPATTTPPAASPDAGTYVVTVIASYNGSITLPQQSTTLTYAIN